MKNNWQKVKLDDYVDILAGYAWKSSRYNKNSDGYPIIRIQNIGIDASDEFVYWDGEFDSRYLIHKGDLLLGLSGSIKSHIWDKEPALLNQRIIRLEPKSELESRFFSWYLKSIISNIEKLGNHALVNNVSVTSIRNMAIPLPPLSIQKKIAVALDTADAIRHKRQQTIDKLDKLVQSVFLDMFGDPVRNEKGWEDDKLGSICNVRSSKRIFKNELVKDGIPFYRGQEIKELANGNNINSNLFISHKRYEEVLAEDNIPKIGDLLLPSITPDGAIWVVDNNYPFYFKDGRVLWIENDNSKLESYYLKYFLKSLFKSNYQKIASGTTFKELKIFILQDIDVLIPPTNLQVQFRNILKSLKTNRIRYNKISDEENTLANALMQKAFIGELEFA